MKRDMSGQIINKTDKPNEGQADVQVSGQPGVRTTEFPPESLAGSFVEQPAEPTGESSVKQPAEPSGESSAEQPVELTGEFPPESSTEPSADTKPSPGLRERKKEQTRQALEESILRLVLEKGYEEVKVEEVCEEVGISRKTFFNYFASKRAAVLGRSYIPSKEQILEALEKYPEVNYLDVVTHCIEDGLTNIGATEEIKSLRKEVMTKSPEIFFRTNKSSLTMQPNIKDSLFDYLTQHPEKRKLADYSLEEECLIGTSTVVCLMRTHAMMVSYRDHTVTMKDIRELLKDYLK